MLLHFRDVDLPRDAELCVRWRIDSYICGDGNAERFFASGGRDGQKYLARLVERLRDWPGSCAHARHDDRIVGQVEMIRDPDDPSAAKINLFYLAPEYRGHGLGAQLEAYALNHVRATGFSRAWLRVSPTNLRAFRFYQKHAWADRGIDDRVNMRVMEKQVAGL